MQKSDSIKNLALALGNAQVAMPVAKKGKENPFFKSKYASLDVVMPLALETLTKQDLTVMQMVSNIDGQSALTTIIMHGPSGEFISSDQPLLLPKEDPQGQGSAITYARRYALMSAIGMVADEDDDGNKASAGKTPSDFKPQPRGKITVPQLEWLLKEAEQRSGSEDPYLWLQNLSKNNTPPDEIPIGKFMEVMNYVKSLPPSKTPDPLDSDVTVTDDDIKALEDGKVPY